jgi:protein TonB
VAEAAPQMVAAAPVVLPVPEGPVTADLALPPPPEKPEPKTEKVEETPVEKPKSAPDKKKAADKPKETTEKAVSAPAASAPKAGSQTNGRAVSPAAYARAVMKKVRSTKKTSGAGKGTVVVGFMIAADGGLAGVRLLQGSGNAALDKIALDHIRRAVPFPMPPEGAGRSYSFEFVGK